MAPGAIHPAVLLWQPPGPQPPVLPGPRAGGVQSLLGGISQAPEHGEGSFTNRATAGAAQ